MGNRFRAFSSYKRSLEVYLTTDHPNGAPFSYPELIRLLMDKDFRDCEINKINKHAREISYLRSIERTYSFYEICIMTRAAPAKILGLNDGGFKGYVADIAIYDPKTD